MAIDAEEVRTGFSALESSDGGAFFAHVADDVDCTAGGVHSLAGRHWSKAEFQAGSPGSRGALLI